MTYEPTIVEKIFRDKDGKVVIWQWPNIPLWSWILFSVLAMVIKRGKPHTGFHLLAESSIFTWAYLELRHGESLFRRILGGLVLADMIVSFFM